MSQEERNNGATQPKRPGYLCVVRPAFITHNGAKGVGCQVIGDISLSQSSTQMSFCFQMFESGLDSYIRISTKIPTEYRHGTMAVPSITPFITTFGNAITMRDPDGWYAAPDITLYEAGEIPSDEALEGDPLYARLEDPKLACIEINYRQLPVSTAIYHQMELSPENAKRLQDFDSLSRASNVKIYFSKPTPMDQEKIKIMRTSMCREHFDGTRFLSKYCVNGRALDLDQHAFKKLVSDEKLGDRRAIKPQISFRDFPEWYITMHDSVNREYQAQENQINKLKFIEGSMWLMEAGKDEYFGFVRHPSPSLVNSLFEIGDTCEVYTDFEYASRNESDDPSWKSTLASVPEEQEIFMTTVLHFKFNNKTPFPPEWLPSVVTELSEHLEKPSLPVFLAASNADIPAKNMINGLRLLAKGSAEYDDFKRILLGNDLHVNDPVDFFGGLSDEDAARFCQDLDPEQRAVFDALRSVHNQITCCVGPPGCGKTLTLAHICQAAAATKKKLIAGASSNKATNELASRISELVNCCRLSNVSLSAWSLVQISRGINRKKTGVYVYGASELPDLPNEYEENKVLVRKVARAQNDKTEEVKLAREWQQKMKKVLDSRASFTGAEYRLEDRLYRFFSELPSDITDEETVQRMRKEFDYGAMLRLPSHKTSDVTVQKIDDTLTDEPTLAVDESTQEADEPIVELFKEDFQKMRAATLAAKKDVRIPLELQHITLEHKILAWAGIKLDEEMPETNEFDGDADLDPERLGLIRQFREYWRTATLTGEVTQGPDWLEHVAFTVLETCDVILAPIGSWYPLKPLHIDGCIVDEAGQSSEVETVSALAVFPNATKIIVGNHLQLPPTVLSLSLPFESEHQDDTTILNVDKDSDDRDPTLKVIHKNEFAQQLALSFLERLNLMGYKTLIIGKQFRMVPQIANIVKDVLYYGKLDSAISTEVSRNPVAQHFQKFLKDQFGLNEKSWAFINVVDGTNEGVGTSRLNVENAKVDLTMLQELVAIPGLKTIKIITPYHGQRKHVVKALSKLQIPEGVDAQCSTIDSVQGEDVDIVILDLVTVAKKPWQANFAKQYNRLNVGVTRARFGLLIVGSGAPAALLPEDAKTAYKDLYDSIVTFAFRHGHWVSINSDMRASRDDPYPKGKKQKTGRWK